MAKKTYIMYGFVTVAVMILIGTYFEYVIFVKDAFRPAVIYLVYIPFLIGIILNAFSYSKANEGYVSFNDVFGSCFKMVLIVLAVRIVWFPVTNFMIPEIKQKAFQTIHTHLMNNPKLSDPQVDTAYSVATKVWYLTIVITLVFSTLLYGAVFSLIGTAFVEKKGMRIMGTDNF